MDRTPEQKQARLDYVERELAASRRALASIYEILARHEVDFEPRDVPEARSLMRAISACKYLKRPEWLEKFGEGPAPATPVGEVEP